MPDNTPHSPQQPWENGWAPDASRAPGTRRLWLAGALALATVAACVTAMAVNGRTSREEAPPAAGGAATDSGPGLLSFNSPSAGTSASPEGQKAVPSATSQAPSSPAAHRSPSPRSDATKAPGGQGSSTHSPAGPAAGTRSVRSVNYPDRYWHIAGDFVRLDPVGSSPDRRAATFTLVEGLGDASCYSFATADGGYLRHRDFLLRAERDDGSRLFEQDATFCPRASAFSGAVMLESVNYPGRFLRHQNFQLKLDPYQNTDLYRADSAFRLVDGLG
ncbi:alpha-L-arabinofuranosidase [Streptomyces bungoensis]|uniref:Alpha-L-arabinofuranosidase n=1 Tax=Streptomyces bungoensis TaxID=285568 RepID=A0A101SRH7_9ACTN|nr:AbfB domain-containing protein [Streptomyces bungoensis]KUN78619.1 alpha-L-arabinofuranosidase [Streptomyces bungoensis]